MRRDWTFIAAIALLTAFALARVASTHRLYGQTLDEPVHLAAGCQWLTSRYTIDLGHPPLVRALCALPLKLSGHPPPVSPDPIQQGNDLHMLPWFNELARPNPASIAVDSDLDWGQDTLRLARAVRELNIGELRSATFTNARLDRHGIRALPLDPHVKSSGWCAVSEMPMAMGRPKGEHAWLSAHRPVRRDGSSIRSYFIA